MSELESLKKKLLYRSNYRGTKEMDMLLSNFVRLNIEKLTESQLYELEEFLNFEDEDIYIITIKIIFLIKKLMIIQSAYY